MIHFRSLLALGRGRRHRSHRDLLMIVLWGAMLASVELAGHRVENDFADAVLLSAVVGMVLTTVAAHRVQPLTIVQAVRSLSRQGANRLARWFLIEYGVDLRITPPIARGFPRDWRTCLGVLCVAGTVLTPLFWLFPGNLRYWIAPRFYLGYLLLLGVIWAAVCMATLVMALFAWTELLNGLSLSFPRRIAPQSRRDRAVLFGLAAAVLTGAACLPVSFAFVMYALLQLAVVTSLLLTPSGLVLLWRPKAGGPLRSFDGRWGWMCLATVLTGFVSGLTFLCVGSQVAQPLFIPSHSSMPLSRGLGTILAWTGVAGLAAITWQILRFVGPGILHNPETPPLMKTASDPDEQWRIHRQFEIQQRRAITRGLEKLFKQAARWKWRRGSGFWIGLQHWFIYGLTRDEDEHEFGEAVIGTPYHRAFPRPARFHFRQITRALNVDLIYVEDGISFKRLVRVLRVMFEIYDVHGGRQRAEDRHFLGLPGVRVLIENYELGTTEPLDLGHGYQEPDYDEIGRARLMLILKDRGEDVERMEVPDESTGTPVFSGV